MNAREFFILLNFYLSVCRIYKCRHFGDTFPRAKRCMIIGQIVELTSDTSNATRVIYVSLNEIQ